MGVAALLCGIYRAFTPAVSDFGDSSELTLVLARNGIAHPTGYPLYVLFGHVFVRLVHALGASWPEAASLWSTLGAGVALVFLALSAWTLTRVTLPDAGREVRAIAAAVPAVAFGLHPVWVLEATHAEVYTWHVAWALLATWFFLRVVTRERPENRDLWEPFVAGLVAGAGLAHHRTSLLLLGPLAVVGFVLALRRFGLRRTGVLVAVALLGAIVPLAGYGSIAYRAFHPAEVQWPVLGPNWSDIFAHVNGREFLHYLGRFAPDPDTKDLLERWVFPAVAVGLLALIGSALLAKRAGQCASAPLAIGAIAFATALSAGLSFAYGVPDPGTYFLMPMALGAAGMAPLVLIGLTGERGRRAVTASVASMTFGVLLAAVIAALCLTSLQMAGERLRVVTANDRIVREMWEAIPGDSAIVLWPWDAYTKLREYQVFAGEKPALYVANPALLGYPNARRAFRERFGADPIAGLENPRIRAGSAEEESRLDALYMDIARNVSAQTPLPVIYMDPGAGILRRLAKPAAPPPAAQQPAVPPR